MAESKGERVSSSVLRTAYCVVRKSLFGADFADLRDRNPLPDDRLLLDASSRPNVHLPSE